jgi:hypothetical protein
MTPPIRFWGTVINVKPRLILSKFEDVTTPRCAGYVLTIDGTQTEGTNVAVPKQYTVAIGRVTMQEKPITIGALVRGDAHPVPENTPDVLAELYRVGVIRVIAPGKSPTPTDDDPRTHAMLMPDKIEAAPRRALPMTALEAEGACHPCGYGLIVCTVKLTDPRFPKQGQWFEVPACLGPDTCPHYQKPQKK